MSSRRQGDHKTREGIEPLTINWIDVCPWILPSQYIIHLLPFQMCSHRYPLGDNPFIWTCWADPSCQSSLVSSYSFSWSQSVYTTILHVTSHDIVCTHFDSSRKVGRRRTSIYHWIPLLPLLSNCWHNTDRTTSSIVYRSRAKIGGWVSCSRYTIYHNTVNRELTWIRPGNIYLLSHDIPLLPKPVPEVDCRPTWQWPDDPISYHFSTSRRISSDHARVASNWETWQNVQGACSNVVRDATRLK